MSAGITSLGCGLFVQIQATTRHTTYMFSISKLVNARGPAHSAKAQSYAATSPCRLWFCLNCIVPKQSPVKCLKSREASGLANASKQLEGQLLKPITGCGLQLTVSFACNRASRKCYAHNQCAQGRSHEGNLEIVCFAVGCLCR